MKALHILLAGSILANALFLGGYLSSQTESEEPNAKAAEIAKEFDFTMNQKITLRSMQRDLRQELVGQNRELDARFNAVVEAMRVATKDDTAKLDQAIKGYNELKAELLIKVAHHGIDFRDTLDERQQALFNKTLERSRFIFAIAGIGNNQKRRTQ